MSLTGKTESDAIKGSISNKSTLGGTLGGSDAVHGGVNNPHIIHGKDGEDGISATHKWNGTVLTITSASGTSSADLKGDKGDKGDTAALYRTVSGEGNIVIDDVSPIEHNVTVTLANKNLINNHTVNGSETLNGITLTENGDGTYTIKGTATANTAFYIHRRGRNSLVLPAGTYTISGSVGDAGFWCSDINNTLYRDRTFTLTEETELNAYIYVHNGDTVDGLLKPMVEPGDKATEFVPNADISTSFISVLDKNGEGEIYFPNEEGIISDVKSYSPTMKIQAHPRVFIITATYERDLSKVIADLEERQSEVIQGENGATFTPSVSDEGVISWTNDKGLPNPSPINIKGPKGADGYTPIKGVDYFDGKNGADGKDGSDGRNGVDAIISLEETENGFIAYFTDELNGTRSVEITNGKDGSDGRDGKDAISPTVTITSIDGGKRITITDANGSKSADIMDGEDGKSGSDGISPTLSVSKSGKVTTISITDKNGTKTATINDGTDGEDGARGADGTSVTVSSVNESTVDGGSNVVTFSDGKTLTVKNGRGGRDGNDGLDGANGVSPSVSMIPTDEGYEMTIYDAVHGEKFYIVRHGVDGKDGTSVTVKNVSESSADGGSNVVTFSDGTTLTVKNGSKGSQGEKGDTGASGKDGKTPVKGTDYFTEADKTEMVNAVITALPKETWVFELEDGSTVKKVVLLNA